MTSFREIWTIYKKKRFSETSKIRGNLDHTQEKKFPETSKIRRNSGNPKKTENLVFRISKKSI